MRRTLMALLLALCILPLQAQKNSKEQVDSIRLEGKVVDSFTREVVDSVRMEILLPDSVTVIDTLWNVRHLKQSFGIFGEWETEGYLTTLPQWGNYLIRCSKRGYKQSITPLNIPRKRYNKKVTSWEADEILLRKAGSYDFDTEMNEVTVQATRIKMFQDGDTVVYNADAFNLSEGSMLDELIRQLPGVELKDGGQITVNGNKVDELLINGKDFFKGDAKVALDNLPAYMVQNVKAYQKADKMAYLDKHHDEMKKKDPWVIDVNLKKQYNKGWLGNAEAGYGTDNRYMGRLFATRFTDHSRLTAYVNTNNINDNSRPGSESSWHDSSSPTGEMKTVSGGLDFHVDSKVNKTEFNTSLTASHSTTNTHTDASSQTFLTGGDVYGRSRDIGENTSTSVHWWGELEMPHKENYLTIRPNFQFSHSRNNSSTLSATFTQDPADSYRGASLDSIFSPVGSQRLQSFLTNRTQNASQGTSTSYAPGLTAYFWCTAPWNGENIHGSINGDYSHSESKSFSHNDLRQTGLPNDFRNQYTLSPSTSANGSVSVNHGLVQFKKLGTLELHYNYHYNYGRGRRSLYRLDQLDHWGADDDRQLGLLPSMTELNTTIDKHNSYNTINRDQTHSTGLSLQKGSEKWGFYMINFELAHERKNLQDERDGQQQSLSRKFNLMQSMFYARFKDFDVQAYFHQSSPAMSYLLDIVDDSNPLSISRGNKDLKLQNTEGFRLGYNHQNMKRENTWNVGIEADVRQNSIANAMTYNRQTGVYTYQPRNINGNWSASANGGTSITLDKNKYLRLIDRTWLSYQRSADYALEEGSGESSASVVHNYGVNQELQLEYRYRDYRVSANANADYSHATSQRANFMTINTVDFSYGFSGSAKLPWALQLDMDLTMHSRRGYEDATMNDNNLIWNASLSKSLLKGKCLTIKLIGHDILQQLSSVRRVLNAQGRSETWYNTQPAYGMLSVAYRLNIQPKKKKE